MKGILALTSLTSLFGAVGFSYGQGLVYFNNTSTTQIMTNSAPGSSVTSPISGPVGSYYFALFVAPTNVFDPDLFAFTGHYGTNTITVGRFNGNLNGGFDPVDINGYFAGTRANFLVRGWSANIGQDYASVTVYLANAPFDGWYGQSQIATRMLGDDVFIPPFLFGSQAGQIPGFTLDMRTVPEPSTLALAALGAVAVLIFRRKVD